MAIYLCHLLTLRETILIQRNAMFEFVTADIDRIKSCVLWTVKDREASDETRQIL